MRQIAGPGALQDAGGVDAAPVVGLGPARSVARQSARLGDSRFGLDRRHPLARRPVADAPALGDQEAVDRHRQRAGLARREVGQCRVQLGDGRDLTKWSVTPSAAAARCASTSSWLAMALVELTSSAVDCRPGCMSFSRSSRLPSSDVDEEHRRRSRSCAGHAHRLSTSFGPTERSRRRTRARMAWFPRAPSNAIGAGVRRPSSDGRASSATSSVARRSSRSRERALLFGYYSRSFIRQQQNWNASLSPETIDGFSPQMQAWLGPEARAERQALRSGCGSIPWPRPTCGHREAKPQASASLPSSRRSPVTRRETNEMEQDFLPRPVASSCPAILHVTVARLFPAVP